MGERCIFLQPAMAKLQEVQALRLRFDPLATLVPPHITLVFPFTLGWSLASMARAMAPHGDALPFPFTLMPPVCHEDFLYFPVGDGWDRVAALHEALYEDLPVTWSRAEPYRPHLTFGRLAPGDDPAPALAAAEPLLPLEGVAQRLVLERIEPSGASRVELALP